MRTLRIPLLTVVAVVLPVASIAADGVASVNGRWNVAPPANSAQNRSWSSPLAAKTTGTTHETRRVIGHAFAEPRRYGTATEWTMRAAIFALAATGNITGSGRDDSADIGKRPLPPPNPEVSPFGSFRGSIR